MKDNHTYYWVIGFIILLAFFQYRLWGPDGSMRNLLQLKRKLANQTIDIKKLRDQNELMMAEISRLQKNNDTIESHARDELGMIKKNEIFYQIMKK